MFYWHCWGLRNSHSKIWHFDRLNWRSLKVSQTISTHLTPSIPLKEKDEIEFFFYLRSRTTKENIFFLLSVRPRMQTYLNTPFHKITSLSPTHSNSKENYLEITLCFLSHSFSLVISYCSSTEFIFSSLT